MANIKSAKKRILVGEKKRLQNKSHRSELRTLIKKADVAIENNEENKAEVVKSAIKKIDSAAGRGLIHKNNAARKKSQLTIRVNA